MDNVTFTDKCVTDIANTIESTVQNIFLEYQNELGIQTGDLEPLIAHQITSLQEQLADKIATGIFWQVGNNPNKYDPIIEKIKTEKENDVMNTKITYMYRDACNYKNYGEIIVKGKYTEDQVDRILNTLNEHEYFIPEQVGFPATRFYDYTEDDHCWHELERNNFTLTNEKATEGDATIEDIVNRFESVKHWDDVYVF